MNNVFKILRLSFLMALPVLLGVSCAEELEYVPGDRETDNSYGVYFPENVTGSSLQLSPDDRPEVTYKVRRTNVKDEISVPVNVTESEKGIFFVSEIYFAEGQDETEFTIAFPNAKADGTEYSVTVSIEDRQYVSIYSKKETALSLTVTVAEWVDFEPDFGESPAKWRDDILSSMYMGLPHQHAEVEVELQQRKDKPGMFRLKAYTPEMMKAIFEVPYGTENKYIVVDATDPKKVWIPKQPIGVTLNADDGFITMASYVDKQFSIDEADSMYGTYDEKNGVITFPVGGVMCTLSKALAPGEWLTGNQSGMLRLMLPGATLQDYSAKLKNLGYGDEGNLSVEVTLGKDAVKFVYKVFEGTLEDGTASLNAQDLADGAVEADGETGPGETIVIEKLKTGKYTLVGYTSDGTGMKDYAFMQFGFVGAGDEKPVDLVIGLEGTDEFAGQGMNRNNSVKLYAYKGDAESEDITEVVYWLGLKKKMPQAPEEIGPFLEKEGKELTEEQIDQLNDKGFSTMIAGLNGDSEYVLVLRAGNGYVQKVFDDVEVYAGYPVYKTGGIFNPVMDEYDFGSFKKISGEDYLLGKTWHYYATDEYDDIPARKRMPTDVYFRKDADGQLRMFGITGMKFDTDAGGVSTEVGVKVTYKPETGYLYMSFVQDALGYCEGKPVKMAALPDEKDKQLPMVGNELMVIGRVSEEDGYLYFVGNPEAKEATGCTFSNALVMQGNGFVHCLKEMLLVDASVDITGK